MVLTEEEKNKKLREIAAKLGISIEELLKKGSPEYIIESYDKNSFQVLNG